MVTSSRKAWFSLVLIVPFLIFPSPDVRAGTTAVTPVAETEVNAGQMAPRAEDEQTADGLYLYISHPDLKNFALANAAGLAKDFIDGAAIMLKWSEIEPEPEVYDWSTLDPWVDQTIALHKKLSLGVVAGLYTPSWLYGAGYGVPKNSFDYNRSSIGTACVVMNQPSFWDPSYLREYGRMMAALALHLRDMRRPDMTAGAAYHALRVVKLSGINNTTEELRVDVTKPDTGPCHQSDATAIWVKSGFAPTKVLAAFIAIASETKKAFPDKLLSLALIHRNAFPPIKDSGNINKDVATPDALTMKILNAAEPLYGSQLLVQWDALWQGRPPEEVLEAAHNGARIGWQMNGFEGAWAGSGCIYPGFIIVACKSVRDFQSILDNGLNLGGLYIEVQGASVLNPNWAPAFEEAHDKLLRKEEQ